MVYFLSGAPNPRPLEFVIRALDELWFRTAMNNRGWKSLARALVLTSTGMRPAQMKRLDPEIHIRPYLDVPNPVVVIPAGKGGNVIVQPLTPDSIVALKLFLRVDAAGTFSRSSFYKCWKLACERADVPFFNPYKLRHTFGSLARRFADLADVQQLMGHTSAKTTARYAQVVPEKLFEAAGSMQKAWDEARGRLAWVSPQATEKKTGSGT